MLEKDGYLPDCQTDKGCIIPPLGETEGRILEIRTLLVSLKGLVDSGTIIRLAGGITWDELDLLAAAETEIRRIDEENEPQPENLALQQDSE